MVRRWILLGVLAFVDSSNTPSHIIFLLADDLGWNDVSFHGSNEIQTPNIDALCYGGINLKRHYTEALCTPSRAALLTGRYPMRYGLQHNVILAAEPKGLPVTEKLLPEYLKRFNYVNRIVGKWHLGYSKVKYTPLYRGFHSHFGFYNGFQDYYTHTKTSLDGPFTGLDLRRNLNPDWSSQKKYATDLFTAEAVNIIMTHNTTRPLFLYLSHLAVHAGNPDNPLQAPKKYIEKFSHIEDESRRIYAAMVSKLDDSVGSVMEALQRRNMLKDSIVVFLSDNGAPTLGVHENHGSNWPFKSQKNSPWEGAVRTPACIWSRRLKKVKRVSSQLMHITDWLPTLYSAAGGNVSDLGPIDGVDMWEVLSRDLESPRKEVVINVDQKVPYAALIVEKIKYVVGTTSFELYDGWFGEVPKNTPSYISSTIHSSKSALALKSVGSPVPHNIIALRNQSQIYCMKKSTNRECSPFSSPCLFNLDKDPCEFNNLFGIHPATSYMAERLNQYIGIFVPPTNKEIDPTSNPKFWNNTWTYWEDYHLLYQ